MIMSVFKHKDDFKKLFDQWFNPLCNYAYSLVHNHVLAKDIVQEVFLHLWEKREKLNISSDVKSYLFKSTYHKTIEKIRVKKLQQRLAKENLMLLEQERVEQQDFDRISEQYRLKERINCSIRQLPPKCQKVFLMSRKNGLTYDEIAYDLGISKKTVENHVMKALDFLRKNLKN